VPAPMGAMSVSNERAARRAADRAHRVLVEDVERICADAGVSRAALARAARVDAGFLARILAGTVRPSLDTYSRLSVALGADLSTRLYPNTGPAIRDRYQARMLEALLSCLDRRWHAFTEVAVRRPARDSIDVVLHDPRARVLVANEIQSELRRIEQVVRWSGEKAASLPSWDAWSQLGDPPSVSQLLVLRRTRATRVVASEFQRQLRVAYPAHPDDALAALTGAAAWPGSAMIWAVVDGMDARLVAGR
jgi:transcriptional regulator with XRE-family HTH domain